MSISTDRAFGWICDTRLDYVAAKAFLDETLIKDVTLESDTSFSGNMYTFGKIGDKQVLIVLCSDTNGRASREITVADIGHNFPGVKLCLMVGIGGGAPSQQHDIRLGDVVVATESESRFAIGRGTGIIFLGSDDAPQVISVPPPTALGTALRRLRTHHGMHGNRIKEEVNKTLAKERSLLRDYSSPPAAADRLYRPEVVHSKNSVTSCPVAYGDHPEHLVERPERGEYDDDPAIHFGRIFSRDTLMKDASLRDKLSSNYDILCFEVGAADFYRHFPCLVIRGICNYSDSHESEEWRGYAAMTAAAYAKDLINHISRDG
ncbi:purine and uridine phosphorylase [Trichoderma velutinum]